MTCCKPSACIISVLAILLGTPALGQSPAIEELRRKPDLTADELQQLDQYFEELVSEVELDNVRDRDRFQQQIVSDYTNSNNSVRFTYLFAERAAQNFAPKISADPGGLSLLLVKALRTLENPVTLDALRTAMQVPHVATRAVAVDAIANLRDKIEGPQITTVIQWLTDAATTETNGIVLARLYRGLNFNLQRDEQVKAMRTILSNRLDAYSEGKVAAESAELEAYYRLLDLAGNVVEADKKPLVSLLAQFLAHYTHRFLYEDLGQENKADLHRLIFMVERVLTRLTNLTPNGSVAAAMGSNSDDRPRRIREALAGWIGEPNSEQKGLLNDAPWQVPAGAGVDLDFSAALAGSNAEPPSESP